MPASGVVFLECDGVEAGATDTLHSGALMQTHESQAECDEDNKDHPNATSAQSSLINDEHDDDIAHAGKSQDGAGLIRNYFSMFTPCLYKVRSPSILISCAACKYCIFCQGFCIALCTAALIWWLPRNKSLKTTTLTPCTSDSRLVQCCPDTPLLHPLLQANVFNVAIQPDGRSVMLQTVAVVNSFNGLPGTFNVLGEIPPLPMLL